MILQLWLGFDIFRFMFDLILSLFEMNLWMFGRALTLGFDLIYAACILVIYLRLLDSFSSKTRRIYFILITSLLLDILWFFLGYNLVLEYFLLQHFFIYLNYDIYGLYLTYSFKSNVYFFQICFKVIAFFTIYWMPYITPVEQPIIA